MTAPSTSPGLAQALLAQPDGSDIAEQMAATAELASRHSGWRWAAVARLVDGGVAAQMLGFAEQGQRPPGRTYEMAVTPCSMIAESGGLVHLSSVAERFPREPGLAQMGVTQYAGMAFRRGDEVIGHVFLMHDAPLGPQEARQADTLLEMCCLHVSHRLELHRVRALAEDWQRRAETDALTGLPNRQAFERELALQLSLVASGARSDSQVAIFDVNRLKQVNDQRGHLAGDELIRLAGRLVSEGRHPQDEVFRIGGDEFALLTDAPTDHCMERVLDHGAAVAAALQGQGFAEAGLSSGSARLSEAGERAAWLALADERMYVQKGRRRRE